jgi:hypothetical protein
MKASVTPTEMLKLVMALRSTWSNELLNVRMIHAQDGHVGATARTALSDLAKCLIVDAQETNRAGRFAGRAANQRAFGAQPRESKAVTAAGLLDQGGIPKRLEDASRIAAHIIFDRQDKTGCQLPERRAGASEGGAVGRKRSSVSSL